ncbi:MAG: type IV toxin-antitoxin system AbiEi family antitoxin domain-containing protein [Bacteroidota bacterium]
MEFRNKFFKQYCFTNHQVELLFPGFDTKNLFRWQQKGYILKLRNGLYTFPEHLSIPGFNLYLANKIYNPSYISLQFALNFYGIIPEIVMRISSVSTLKTKKFVNRAGTFEYRNVKPQLFFGYEIKKSKELHILIAEPEKAIIDLLYLNPFYNNEKEMRLLRCNDKILKQIIHLDKLLEYAENTNNKMLVKRIHIFKNVYNL